MFKIIAGVLVAFFNALASIFGAKATAQQTTKPTTKPTTNTTTTTTTTKPTATMGIYSAHDIMTMSYRGSYSKLIDDGKGLESSGILGYYAHPYAVDADSKTVFFNTGGGNWADTPSPYVLEKIKADGWRVILDGRERTYAEQLDIINNR